MGAIIIAFPGERSHDRVPSSSREASPASKSVVTPLAFARSVLTKRCHHSAGMLFRVLHFGTVQRPASISAAKSSGDGQRSMISRKDDGAAICDRSVMATNLGQSVLKCKDKSALDAEIPLGHTVQMADSDQEDHYKQEFIARTRNARIATGKKQWQVAELLGIKQDQYKHYEVGRLLPHYLIGRFCLICSIDPGWLITGKGAKPLQPPHVVASESAPPAKPKRVRRSRAA